jgi:hypothetical protein
LRLAIARRTNGSTTTSSARFRAAWGVGAVPKPEHGRIVWATMRSSDGRTRKKRTAVILTRSTDISESEPFVVVAITTTFPDPPPEDHVLLPYDPTGRCVTRLKQRTAAVCSWFDEINESDIEAYAGVVPPTLMLEIVRRSGLDIVE